MIIRSCTWRRHSTGFPTRGPTPITNSTGDYYIATRTRGCRRKPDVSLLHRVLDDGNVMLLAATSNLEDNSRDIVGKLLHRDGGTCYGMICDTSYPTALPGVIGHVTGRVDGSRCL
uniref:U1740ai n=2 Tax=Mycobacterium leprae TaxID=1769 RepID=Q50093_MYCLR|nr:u1740ai [Mycobacterium leprae]